MKMSVNSSSVHWIYSVESYSLFTFLTLSAGHDAEVIRGGLPVGRMAEVLKVLLTVGMPLAVFLT